MEELLLKMRKFVAPEFVFGERAAHLTGRYARNLGAKKVLLVSDNSLLEFGWPQQVKENIEEKGLATALFADVSPNPRDTEVSAGAEVYLSEGCDAIVAVGGGSPMDCAKGIGIVSTNGLHILEFEGVDKVDVPGPPLICVPTTAGSSADISQFAIVTDTDRKVKVAIVSKTMVPDAALIDPLTTYTMGPELTANTGMDALTHAIEAYVSNANSPVTDLFALEAVRRIAASLPLAVQNPEDREARGNMMLGSMYAGLAFSNAILGAVHAMSHSLGGLSDLPHGLCNAILLDHVIASNYRHVGERYVTVARAMGSEISDDSPDEEKERAVLQAVRDLKKDAGVTTTLSDLGIRKEDLKVLAELASCDPCMHTNPCEMGAEELQAIYEQAF
jgi:alcohol dehydrogenase class IV